MHPLGEGIEALRPVDFQLLLQQLLRFGDLLDPGEAVVVTSSQSRPDPSTAPATPGR